MSEKENIQKLIFNHNRRLQVLKEQQALRGIGTPPEVILEIEDIEAAIQQLQTQLTLIISDEVRMASPLIHLYTFGKRPQNEPEQAHVIDWRNIFDSTPPRTIPSPEVWQSSLVPEILALPDQLDGSGMIRLYSTGALSVGFTFGTAFKQIGRYLIEVEQFYAGQSHFWYSDEVPPKGQEPPEFVGQNLVGNPEATDGAIIVYAAPNQSLAEIVESVGNHWGEANTFKASLNGTSAIKEFKGVLVLEAEAASTEKRGLQSWEAAVLARQSVRQVTEFVGEFNPQKLHLFLATPLGLAVFLGHQWNAIGKKIQCYEWVGGEKVYAPSCQLEL
jgi:hypothetical protein